MKRWLSLFALSLAALSACDDNDMPLWRGSLARPTVGGDVRRGGQWIEAYGCGACHVIPGIRGARGRVAAPLSALARRTFIAGELPNTPENLEDWIMHPRALRPRTAMPELGISEPQARDIVAYLYTLD